MRYIGGGLMAIFILSASCVLCAAAVDENRYNKDTVPVEESYACQVGNASACEEPVLLDKTTAKVKYYWSAAANRWMSAGNEQAILQDLYDKREEIRTRRKLKEMQDEMDKRRRESMTEGQYNTPAHK